MKGDLTLKQKAALKELEKSLKLCSDSGVKLCGMDGNIYYANQQALDHYADKMGKSSRNGDYCEVAQCQNLDQDSLGGGLNEEWCGTVKSYKAYTNSGGW